MLLCALSRPLLYAPLKFGHTVMPGKGTSDVGSNSNVCVVPADRYLEKILKVRFAIHMVSLPTLKYTPWPCRE